LKNIWNHMVTKKIIL